MVQPHTGNTERDVELLAVSLQFALWIFAFNCSNRVCAPPHHWAHPDRVCNVIHSTIARLETQHTDVYFAISSDFNHVSLNSTLTNFYQFVHCPTRKKQGQLISCMQMWRMQTVSPQPHHPLLGKADLISDLSLQLSANPLFLVPSAYAQA